MRAVGDLKQTEAISSRLVRLPLFFDLTHKEQDLIIEEIQRFFVA